MKIKFVRSSVLSPYDFYLEIGNCTLKHENTMYSVQLKRINTYRVLAYALTGT